MKKNIKKLTIIVLLLLIVTILFTIFYLVKQEAKLEPSQIKIEDKTTEEKPDNKETVCLNFSGKYLKNYNECEFRNIKVGKDACKEMKGSFSDCASACRHSTKSGSNSFCTTECVGVCSWN